MLELINVSKRFGTVTALEPLDFSLEPAKTYVLLGTSGCGKSTLLKIAMGLVTPDTGCVQFNGEKLTPENALSYRQRIGYVIQNGGLFPHLTAEGNATLVANYLGWDDQRVGDRLGELAELTQLEIELLGRYPAQLSGGQQQRVSLMRALMLQPDVLLMDEPLGALDPIIRGDLQSDLREIFVRLNRTVVIVTHDLHEAAFFADEILLMRDGRVVQRGTIKELIDSPADPFVTQFVGAQRTSLSDAPAGGNA